MKAKYIILLFSLTLCKLTFTQEALAQEEQELTIPLTNPGKSGSLKLHQVSGSINVTGYNGKEVLIKAKTEQEDKEISKDNNGMFRIPNNSYNMSVVEKDNEVEVSSNSVHKPVNFDIMVPIDFSLNIHTVNNGDIVIKNINGEIEANNVNGAVFLSEISGSVVASSINGKIEVGFNKITPDVPMAFSSLNGKIEVTFPSNVKATAKIRSDRGEVYSDFEMNILPIKPKVEKKEGGSYKKYSIDNWVFGEINGGGPEFLFKNMNGNIYIKKK
ncbi:hypothetical protein [Chondrinema litorale]|uniref:hypothetical protein n=1 Tax=Chondrinema litorale TaxID=2994555 RepID=UPI002542B606|nr:hypothetical protein [Chondrinema litorale]UZR95772.1 hypothetical protein OQ292_08095 [Chondrinema litorale]